MINAAIRDQVHQRAGFACEYCGISETDVGGQLTIDHFRPASKGGDDSPKNLVYCCARCNQYKSDYWPECPGDLAFWNPHHESASQHLFELDDGTLHPLTPTGTFTLHLLRLNRPPLVAHRLRRRQEAERVSLLTRYRDLMLVHERLLRQQSALMEEQQRLLAEQREMLRALIRKRS